MTELGCKFGRSGRGKNKIQKTGIGKRELPKRDSQKRDSEKWDSENKIGRPGQKRDSENEIRKNWIRKNGIRKNRIRPSSRLGPAWQKLDHLCLCSVVATPKLQVRVCMPRGGGLYPTVTGTH
jgi:hypothetical protein